MANCGTRMTKEVKHFTANGCPKSLANPGSKMMHDALPANDSSVEKGNLLEVHSGAKCLAKPMLFQQ